MAKLRVACFIALRCLLLYSVPCGYAAQTNLSVDTGECGVDISSKPVVVKSPGFQDKFHDVSAYGVLSFRRVTAHGDNSKCHVVYELFVSIKSRAYVRVKQFAWDTESGEIAGIDLIGISLGGSKFAADFWLAEGDGVEHRPVVFDVSNGHAIFKPLGNRIQARIHGCDQNEDFIGVTNAGEAIFAIPPSEYDDSPACGDKGLWHFNLNTGLVYRAAKYSGDKWK